MKQIYVLLLIVLFMSISSISANDIYDSYNGFVIQSDTCTNDNGSNEFSGNIELLVKKDENINFLNNDISDEFKNANPNYSVMSFLDHDNWISYNAYYDNAISQTDASNCIYQFATNSDHFDLIKSIKLVYYFDDGTVVATSDEIYIPIADDYHYRSGYVNFNSETLKFENHYELFTNLDFSNLIISVMIGLFIIVLSFTKFFMSFAFDMGFQKKYLILGSSFLLYFELFNVSLFVTRTNQDTSGIEVIYGSILILLVDPFMYFMLFKRFESHQRVIMYHIASYAVFGVIIVFLYGIFSMLIA